MLLEAGSPVRGEGDRRRHLPREAESRRVRRDLLLVLDVEVPELVPDAAAQLARERAVEPHVGAVHVRALELAALEALHGPGAAAAHGGEQVELVGGAAGEHVAPRPVAAGGDALRRDEIRVGRRGEAVGEGEGELLGRSPHRVEREILGVERVVACGIPQVQLGGEVVAGEEAVGAALPDEIDGGRDARDQVPLPVTVVQQDVVVVLLADRDARQQRDGGSQGELELLRILRRRGTELWRDGDRLRGGQPGTEAGDEHGAGRESPNGHGATNIIRRRRAGRAFSRPRSAGARSPDGSASAPRASGSRRPLRASSRLRSPRASRDR